MHQLIQTEDGSTTLYVPELNEHYHSVHGAIQESLHIFIQAGLDFHCSRYPAQSSIRILEAGFGTGLNAYLTSLWASRQACPVYYHTLEKYPLSPEEASRLNYSRQTDSSNREEFIRLHICPWEQENELTPFFRLYKQKIDFREINFRSGFDLVFFDAFNPDVQPHLWTADVFRKFARALRPGGILVTYCVKGTVKQSLRECGFILKRLPGPPGKRQMLRAELPENKIV